LVVLSLFPAASSNTKSSDNNITLVFTGDIMLGRNIEKEIEDRDDIYYPFRGFGDYTRDGDITFGNLENCVSLRGEKEKKMYTFRSKPETLQGLVDAGFDIIDLANNHVSDFGADATKDTMQHLKEYGLEHVGLWYLNEPAVNATITRPIVIEAKGIKFAYLCYGENLSYESIATDSKPAPVPTSMSVMKADIEYAKTLADVIIVSIHWVRLPQYVFEADQGQIDLCRQLCDYGADILANHGPHALQEVEYYNGSLIMYSLGNAVFDLVREEAFKCFIARVHLDGTQMKRLELIPIVMNDHRQFIARGNILKEDITEGLYLDWSDYDSRMFNSDEPLTDYEGPELKLKDILTSPWVWLIAISAVFLLVIVILIIRIWRRSGDAKEEEKDAKK